MNFRKLALLVGLWLPLLGHADLVAEYRFDATGWSGVNDEVRDSSGNGFHGVANQVRVDNDSILCRSADLTADVTDYLSLDHRALDGLGDFTISVWAKTTNTNRYQAIVSGANAGGANELVMLFEDEPSFLPAISIGPFSESEQIDIDAFNDGAWHHLVWTRRVSNNRSCFYLDGRRQGCSTHPDSNDRDDLEIDSDGFIVGQEQDSVGGGFELSQAWDGLLDELLIFDEDLNQGAVQRIYDHQRSGSNWDGSVRTCTAAQPRALYRFDANTWAAGQPDVLDSSGNDLHGTSVAAQPTQGKVCNAADFSAAGTGDYVLLDEAAIDGLDDFTIMTWVRGNDTNSAALISAARSGQNNELIMWIPNGTTFSAFVAGRSTNLSMPNLWDGQWHHLAWTRAGQTHCLYVDGALQQCRNGRPATTLNVDSGGLILAQEQDSVGNRFDSRQALEGLLDELMVFETVLSASDIQTIYNNHQAGLDWDGSARTCPSPGAQSFRVIHDGLGLYCAAETVVVQAINNGAVATSYAGTVELRTGTGVGTWRLSSGDGVLIDSTLDDGFATYAFAAADQGVATFALDYTGGPPLVNVSVIDALDTATRDDALHGPITFTASGYTVTANAITTPSAAVINDPLIAQTAGSDFAIHLTAYGTTPDDPVCGVIEEHAGAIDVAAWQAWIDPGTGPVRATLSGSAVGVNEAAATSHTLNFVQGRAVLSAKYKDVGRLRLNFSSGAMRGATDAFVSRPANLLVHQVASLAGGLNPAATSALGPGFVPAQAPFVVQVDVLDAEDDRVPSYGADASTEAIGLGSAQLELPVGGVNPGLSNVTLFNPTATVGRFENNQVNYAEAGVIRFRAEVADGDFMGTGPVIGSLSEYVGRFYADHYQVDSSLFDLQCGSFVYMSAPHIEVNYAVSARGEVGALLSNYDAALMGSALPFVGLTAEQANDGVELSARFDASIPVWQAGVAQISDTNRSFARHPAPDGPYDALRVGVHVEDSLDGSVLLNADMNAATTGDCLVAGDCEGVQIANASVLYGRLMVLPAVGPENETLNVDLEAQVFIGSAFAEHRGDSCTAYAASLGTLSNFQDNLQTGETTLVGPSITASLVNGHADANQPLQLSAPGIGNEGSTDLRLQAPAWLRYDWFGLGEEDPVNTATFGQFRGHDRIVLWIEEPL